MSTDHETVDAVGESNDQTDLGNKQSKEHSKGVGQYFSLDTIDKLLEFARGAQPAPIYASYPGIHVPYELLKREGWKDKVSSLADMWVAVGIPTLLRSVDPNLMTKFRVQTTSEEQKHAQVGRLSYPLMTLYELLACFD